MAKVAAICHLCAITTAIAIGSMPDEQCDWQFTLLVIPVLL